ncbi:hypothetical protein NON20_26335 (plasmid) [Synechocystis sp. B12]|jgi:hypothetical protein|nr:hypothetical protein NON20_26335 [Synechocystis sp. B12]
MKITASKKLSLQQLANLPLPERRQYLAQFIPAMTDDFLHNPELTEFNVLDTEDWDLDYDKQKANLSLRPHW